MKKTKNNEIKQMVLGDLISTLTNMTPTDFGNWDIGVIIKPTNKKEVRNKGAKNFETWEDVRAELHFLLSVNNIHDRISTLCNCSLECDVTMQEILNSGCMIELEERGSRSYLKLSNFNNLVLNFNELDANSLEAIGLVGKALSACATSPENDNDEK